ncbi:APO protein 4, mitochondrial-like [Ziziphus jujuba]|uniref:APO protein 4, mitochondrial-like n=1 Tax=Ziziphus jujuba TaxID=326968 RepID=A0A6P3Z6D9_ZIZJJ|nr:APO protein 4, mitochondrial-like [Ziziphus jujuba]
MAMRKKSREIFNLNLKSSRQNYYGRFYSSKKVDLRQLRSMIHERIENRAKDYPIKGMLPVAQEVLNSRKFLIRGVSILTKVFPVLACKFCPEVYVGEKGHLIQTCCGYRRFAKNRVHEWIIGGLNDILVPVETFHLQHMHQDVIRHHQRFDFERVPAVVELCWQAGAVPSEEDLCPSTHNIEGVFPLSPDELRLIANRTLRAWEMLREGVQKLILAYPVKVCKHCSEVHVGPFGHKVRICGVFKYESRRGAHFWEKAQVDDLVPPKTVWHRRPQDPPVLLNEGKDFYGHAPAVVDLCIKAGVIAPLKYHCAMKVQGLSGPVKAKV